MEKPLLYFSNSLEKLASLLCSNLFLSPSSFLEKKVVLIPQKHWENELIRHFLTKEELPIGAGVEFSLLGSGVHMLLKKMSTCSLSFPSEELLALHLYHLLEERLERKEEKGRELLYYLEGEKEVLLLQKRRKKILSLSKQLIGIVPSRF
ncbi:MAG: exodeoxyribonuclease V subunit gamma [Simkania negevensis]|nr:exodeoxyribonuclease V subunit gamma [Simkania negevensis]